MVSLFFYSPSWFRNLLWRSTENRSVAVSGVRLIWALYGWLVLGGAGAVLAHQSAPTSGTARIINGTEEDGNCLDGSSLSPRIPSDGRQEHDEELRSKSVEDPTGTLIRRKSTGL